MPGWVERRERQALRDRHRRSGRARWFRREPSAAFARVPEQARDAASRSPYRSLAGPVGEDGEISKDDSRAFLQESLGDVAGRNDRNARRTRPWGSIRSRAPGHDTTRRIRDIGPAVPPMRGPVRPPSRCGPGAVTAVTSLAVRPFGLAKTRSGPVVPRTVRHRIFGEPPADRARLEAAATTAGIAILPRVRHPTISPR